MLLFIHSFVFYKKILLCNSILVFNPVFKEPYKNKSAILIKVCPYLNGLACLIRVPLTKGVSSTRNSHFPILASLSVIQTASPLQGLDIGSARILGVHELGRELYYSTINVNYVQRTMLIMFTNNFKLFKMYMYTYVLPHTIKVFDGM